jgi:hypothetical protein
MRKKRPCGICRRWFLPRPHQVGRQATCSKKCQREKHRRACCDWHRQNPEYDRERRLRGRVLKEGSAEDVALIRVDPLARLDESAVRDAIGLDSSVIIIETGEVIVDWVRDAIEEETETRCGFARRLVPPWKRDAIGSPAMSP